MKKLLLILLLTPLLLFSATDNRSLKIKKLHEQEQRIALVVGNNNYESFSTLKNPINDAKAIRDLLTKKKFEVLYFEDIDQKHFKKAIKQFTNKLSSGGVGLFYFAGHGIQVEGENYLIPKDADIADKDDVDGESVPIAYLTSKLKKASNRLNIIILDACRNDPFSRGSGGGLAPIYARGTYIAYATEAGKAAKDGKGKHGVFTKHLIKYMDQPLTIDEVFTKTRTAVYNDTDGEQFPGTYNQVINGSFFFTLPKAKKIPTGSAKDFDSKNRMKYLFTINTNPKDAKIEITNIDAQYKKGIKLKNGEYTVQVSRDGYETKTGNIKLSSDYVLNVRLNKILENNSSSAFFDVAVKEFILDIETLPKDAKVHIEGILEDYEKGMKLPKAEYRIKVSRDGYIAKYGVINLNKNHILKITLEEIKNVTQAPLFSEVQTTTKGLYIDGNLMWQDNKYTVELRKNEIAAKNYCERLTLNGFTDWMLPDIEDLKSLKNQKAKLKYMIDEKYWSNYGKVDFSDSSINAFLNTNDYVTEHDHNYIRCVRKK